MNSSSTAPLSDDPSIDLNSKGMSAASRYAFIAHPQPGEQRCLLMAILLSIPLLLPLLSPWLAQHWPLNGWLQLLLASPIQFWLGARFYRGTLSALKARKGNSDLLVTLATSLLWALSCWHLLQDGAHSTRLYFHSSALIITFLLCAQWLASLAWSQATHALVLRQQLSPQQARVRRDGQEQMLPLADLRVGDIIIVRPGEGIPVDGCVLEGSSHVDELLLSGEPLPLPKHPGSRVYAGSQNKEGLLLLDTLALGEQCQLARILHQQEQTQAGRLPVEQLVERVSAVCVPGVLCIALFTMLGWGWVSADWLQATLSAITVLVIACPCALLFAVPSAILSGTNTALSQGILLRGIDTLQRAHDVGTLAFSADLPPAAHAVIQQAHERGIHSLLFSTEKGASARKLARTLGVDEVQSALLPEDQADHIRARRRQQPFQRIAMLGAETGDTPALAAADIRIARGSDTAMLHDTADINLLRSDPYLITASIDICRLTYRKLHENLFWAFIYHSVGIPMAAFGLLNPLLAGLFMALSSLSVLANALLLKRWRPVLSPHNSSPDLGPSQ